MNAALAEVRTGMRIADLQSGFELLSRLPLANSERAEGEINHFLDSLLQSPPAADVYLQLLEQTRISLCFIEEELARRYTNKALPLGRNEEEAFRQVVGTWLKAARAYAHCAQLQGAADSAAHAERLALILHRCIYYTGMAITEHFRARQQLPAGLWLSLLGYYASAEEWGIATLPVADSLDCHGRNTHCMAATVALLLLDLAGPYSLSTIDLGLVRRWASNWAPLLSLQPPVDGEPLPPLVVDLMHDAGLQSPAADQRTEQLRRLDSSRLAMQISAARTQLQQRIAPAQLGLGEDCSSAQCQRLLNRLYRPWCLLRSGRRFRRHDAAGTATVCTGFAGMHFHISGSEFSQPESGNAYSRQDFDNLFAFRHMLDPTQMLEVRQSQLGLHLENWSVLDQCANGFRMLRSLAGGRIEAGQLLALCPPAGAGRMADAGERWQPDGRRCCAAGQTAGHRRPHAGYQCRRVGPLQPCLPAACVAGDGFRANPDHSPRVVSPAAGARGLRRGDDARAAAARGRRWTRFRAGKLRQLLASAARYARVAGDDAPVPCCRAGVPATAGTAAFAL